jgi:hypothetical protein
VNRIAAEQSQRCLRCIDRARSAPDQASGMIGVGMGEQDCSWHDSRQPLNQSDPQSIMTRVLLCSTSNALWC